MHPLAPELAEKFAGYIVDRRDKRIITFSVLALYAAALVHQALGAALGAAAGTAALDSIETLAAVVVVAHIVGGVAQRAVATSARNAPPAPSADLRRSEASPEGRPSRPSRSDASPGSA